MAAAAQGSPEPPAEDLSRLAALYGVATSYSPSPDRTVAASATAVTLVLAALGVDTGTPEATRAALADRERELGERLLPPTVVLWSGGTSPRSRPSRTAPGCASRPNRARRVRPPSNSRPGSTG